MTQHLRPTLGLAMIVKNEAENLPRVFESIQGCFDQICITDTGSTDDTKEIAAKLGAEVYEFTWCNDFAAARNVSYEPLKTDYIFWMDGDDILEGRDEFLSWRNDIMHLADFWLANYVYASKPDGTPACTFVRERVTKRSKNLKWKYFVHEGIVPGPDTKVNFIPSWRVRHMRTEMDLAKDRSRNLSLLEKNQSKLDARMKYYWGKELFEAGKRFDAIRKLEEVTSSGEEMEMHDRILAMQYLTLSYMEFGQYDKAISIALTAIQLAPQRAELYVAVGDCYLKMNQFLNAVPFYQAACKCYLPAGNQVVSPIFFHDDAYGVYPKNQLARIYANLGKIDEAKEVAFRCHGEYKHPETKQILDELTKMSTLMCGRKAAKPTREIVFSGTPTSPYVWDGEEYRKQGMGGSETACIEMAEHLAKLSGRKVKVFNARADIKTIRGVEYLPVAQIQHYFSQYKPYLHISWRHNVKLTDAPTYAWCHDLITPGIEETSNYVKAICLTPFHADFMHNMQLVPYDKIWISRNGIHPDRFLGPKPAKNPNKIVFPSSPDRGLDRAILVCDEVRKEFPDLELHVFYGIEHLPQWGHQALHDKLKGMFASRPWVKYHGKTEQNELIRHFKEAVIWLHPCDFIETSCITAMEMIASGVYPVTRRLGGLKDTLALAEKSGMATLLNHDCVTSDEFRNFTNATLQALREKRWEREAFQSFKPQSLSWEKVAESWLTEMEQIPVDFESMKREAVAVSP